MVVSRRRGLNPRPIAYEAIALPLSYSGAVAAAIRLASQRLPSMPDGSECPAGRNVDRLGPAGSADVRCVDGVRGAVRGCGAGYVARSVVLGGMSVALR